MEAATMKHVQAEEGLVENEVSITVTDEVVEGNEFHQGGEETEGILCFEGNEKGDIESNDSITEEKPRNEKSDSNITKADSQKSLGTVYDRKRDGNPKDDSLNDLHPLPSEFQSQSGGRLSLKDRRLEVIEFDVERVIEEQDTHDLYCPNCNSCITKRVILIKRETTPIPPVVEPDPQPSILYRCLSCFTYFIGTACGCEPVLPPGEHILLRIVNWFFPCFQPSRGEKTAENDVPGRTHEWDILKSIIYGGLTETIASLGVVSSAAASDASTLNIVVLGLANLMSGLIIIIHNITELKNDDHHEETSEANLNIDRYRETLGRKENFRLHAIVTVMSFLVFGLLPPITYGFSFHRSDDKLYKLITCAAASLVCIILLSIGKAHVQKPPKHYFRTILKYLFSGLSASGFCYAVGLLINRFLQNLGWFETTSAPSTVFLETRSMKSGPAFYE